MSIIIQNISQPGAPLAGTNKYRVRINQTVICEFDHDRKIDGLAQCLRDAADAVDAIRADREASIMRDILKMQALYGVVPGSKEE